MILSSFINRYESSSYVQGKTMKKRRIAIVLRKMFSDYGKSNYYLITEEIEKCIVELMREGFIVKGRLWEFGDKEIALNQEEDSINKIYAFLKRDKLETTNDTLLNLVKKEMDHSYLDIFLKHIYDAIQSYETTSPYVDKGSVACLNDVISILKAMHNLDQEISFRKFSIQVFHDSKKLEHYKQRIFFIIRDFYQHDIEDADEAFALYNILKNPSYVYIKGNMVIQIRGQIIDLKELNYAFAISSENISSLKIHSIQASKVITIENLTSFYDMEVKDSLLIYLGGYHNAIRRNFLFKIYDVLKDKVSYYHFGDIDAGGFHIYLDLCKKTKIPFHTFKMDIATLQRYIEYAKPLTQNDRARLSKLKELYSNPVIDFMLENGIKLEQEIIENDIIEVK